MVIFWRSVTWSLPFGIVRLDRMSSNKSSLNQRPQSETIRMGRSDDSAVVVASRNQNEVNRLHIADHEVSTRDRMGTEILLMLSAVVSL